MTELDPSQRLSEAHACNQLGALYNKLGQYTNAVRHFERHYALAVELNEEETGIRKEGGCVKSSTPASFLKADDLALPDVGVAAVQLGIVKGNAQMGKLFELVTDARKRTGLLYWKAHGTFESDKGSSTLKGH